jgi:hypothetical protein
VVGSAVKLTDGAAGRAGSAAGVGAGGGGGGGVTAFFLHPAANIASTTARQMTESFLLFNINIAS